MRRYAAFRLSKRHKPVIIPPKHRSRPVMVVLLMTAICMSSADNAGAEGPPVQVNGVFPNLTVMAKGVGSDSEAGIGALIPWAEKLWAVGYVAHIRGEGLGLYEISDNMTMRRHPAAVTGIGIAGLAELYRQPFDIPVAESEVVGTRLTPRATFGQSNRSRNTA